MKRQRIPEKSKLSFGKFLPEDVDTDLCTHVLYGFAVLDGSQLIIKSHDPWADIDNSKQSSSFFVDRDLRPFGSRFGKILCRVL